MKRALVIIFSFFSSYFISGQEIYLSGFHDLWRFNPDDCTFDFVIYSNRPLYDISFHPDGTLYGVSGNGHLFSINLVNGSSELIHDFPEDGQTALTIGADGIMYLMGTERNIWTYDRTNDIATNLGDTGFPASGDLTFYKGELYVATSGSRIVRIDLDNPSLSSLVIEPDIVDDILGIVSDFVGCNEINVYATGNNEAKIYKIDFEDKSMEFLCQLPFEVTGGASTAEFLSSNPVNIKEVIIKNPDCNNTGGEIVIQSAFGFGALQYAIDDGPFQTENVFPNLAAGTYTLQLIDAIGCLDSLEVTLVMNDAPSIDSVSIEPPHCGSNNGSISLHASGGTGPLFYSLDEISYQPSNIFTNLSAGTYFIFLKDSTGCTFLDTVLIEAVQGGEIVSVDVQNTTCGQMNGMIAVETNDHAGMLYSLNGGAYQSSAVFDHLGAGQYLMVAQNINGCHDTVSITVDAESIPKITAIDHRPEDCGMGNGAMTIVGLGGSGAYQYSIDGITFQAWNHFPNLHAGAYTVYIIDEDSCFAKYDTELPARIRPRLTQLKAFPSTCGKNTGNLQFEVEGGTYPLVFTLNNGVPQFENQFNELGPGTYTLRIKDASGCTIDTTVSITQTGCPLFIPNVFSPNGDGNNDLFRIQSSEGAEGIITRFFIFDRWGDNIYEQYDLSLQSPTGWWDGTSKRWTLSAGVYTYFLEIQFANGERTTYRGDITLVR